MELGLSRVDLLGLSGTNPGCAVLLPLGKKKQQKLVVGDRAGAVACFGWRKGAAETSFKDSGSGSVKKEVSSVALGGKGDAANYTFASTGTLVRGFSRKGKQFYDSQSAKFPLPPLTEDIRRLHVVKDDDRLFMTSEFTLSEFLASKQESHFLANDRINDLAVQHVMGSGGGEHRCLLACQDRVIRVVSNGVCVCETLVDGGVTAVHVFSTVSQYAGGGGGSAGAGAAQPEGQELLWGTENGILGQLFIESSVSAEGKAEVNLRRGWTVPNGRRLGAIACIASSDVTKDGTTDVIVGRDDGTVEVWSTDVGAEPSMIFSRCINESVTSVACGIVTAAGFDDVVLTTFSGKVISFSSDTGAEELRDEPEDDDDGMPKPVDAKAKKKEEKEEKKKEEDPSGKKIQDVTKEIDKLKKEVAKEKEKYSKHSTELISTQYDVKMKDRFVLDETDACYTLTVEMETPIESVVLQSTMEVDIVDVENNAAIVSKTRCPPDGSGPSGDTAMIATFRCDNRGGDLPRRLQMKVRTSEGSSGQLTAYIVPQAAPKTCPSCSYKIYPLSHHQRLQAVDELRPWSELQLTGAFSLAQAHSWLSGCLPEVPERLTGGEVTFCFQSTFVGTALIATYKKGEATYRSDSVTTLAVLKEHVTREATARKTQVNMKSNIRDETVVHFLHLLRPMLEWQLSLVEKNKVMEALKELRVQEDDIRCVYY